jgi:uncharacterized cysteine cluster protein YcgN (CxxCxxCC family)
MSQQLLLQEFELSLEQIEAKLDQNKQEKSELLQNLSDQKSENEEILSKNIELQRNLKILEIEKQELFNNVSGELTNRTGKLLNHEIENLEVKFKDYEQIIEELQDEKVYQQFIYEQLEETYKKTEADCISLRKSLKKSINWMKKTANNMKKSEERLLIEYDNTVTTLDSNYIIETLKKIKKTITENYTKKSKPSQSKLLKENNPKSRLPNISSH